MAILSKGATLFIEDKIESRKGEWSKAWLGFITTSVTFAGVIIFFLILGLLFRNTVTTIALYIVLSVALIAVMIPYYNWVYRKYGRDRAAYEQKLRAEIEAEAALFLERRKQAELRGEINP